MSGPKDQTKDPANKPNADSPEDPKDFLKRPDSADGALDHLLQRLELAIVSSGFGVWEYDLQAKKLLWDQQMFDIYRVSSATFVPTRESWRALLHPDERGAGEARFDRALRGQTVGVFESRIFRGDGSVGYVEGTGRLQADKDGRPVLLVGLNRDITERKQAELHQATVAKTMTLIAERQPLALILRTLVEFVESAHTASFCSILLLDETGEHFELGAGPRLEKFFEQSIRGVAIGPDVGSCGAAASLKTRVISDDVQTDPKWTRFREAAAEAGVVSCWSEPIILGDRVLGTFAIYHQQRYTPSKGDIQMVEGCAQLAAVAIQHARTEDALEVQRTKLLSSIKMAALGEMASGIAHEVNNPLTIIVGKAWQLKKQLEEGSINQSMFAQELGNIVETSNRIAKVIKGLQSFSRNADQDPMEQVLVLQTVEDTLELSKERFRNHGIELRLRIADENLMVSGRPAQIAQVLLNLLNNAFDAVSKLPEKWVELSVDSENSFVVIRVTDSGSGLPDGVAEKIMQPFFTTKEVGKGTGLGLSISKGIVEDHRGRLYYDSASTHTRFVVELPAEASLSGPT